MTTMMQAMLDAGVEQPKVGTVMCKYCGGRAALVTGKKIYPHRSDLFKLNFYECEPCDARVGCHKDSEEPLGELANSELRGWRIQAHNAFDPIWKKKEMSRNKAYAWLRGATGLSVHQCHIGSMDKELCKLVIKCCKNRCNQLQCNKGTQ